MQKRLSVFIFLALLVSVGFSQVDVCREIQDESQCIEREQCLWVETDGDSKCTPKAVIDGEDGEAVITFNDEDGGNETVVDGEDGEIIGLPDGEDGEVVIIPDDGDEVVDGEEDKDQEEGQTVIVVEQDEDNQYKDDECRDLKERDHCMQPGNCDWVDGTCYDQSCTERILAIANDAKVEDFATEFHDGRNEIRNTFRFSSDNLGEGCFTGQIQAIMSDRPPMDMTQKGGSRVNIEDGALRFTYHGDEIHQYCDQDGNSANYNCVFAFRILYGKSRVASWIITQDVEIVDDNDGELDTKIRYKIAHVVRDIEHPEIIVATVGSDLVLANKDFKGENKDGELKAGEPIYVIHNLTNDEFKDKYQLKFVSAELRSDKDRIPLDLIAQENQGNGSGRYTLTNPIPGDYQLFVTSKLEPKQKKEKRRVLLDTVEKKASGSVHLKIRGNKQEEVLANEKTPNTSTSTNTNTKQTNNTDDLIIIISAIVICLAAITGAVIFYNLRKNHKRQYQTPVSQNAEESI